MNADAGDSLSAVREEIRDLEETIRTDERDLAWKLRRARIFRTALVLGVSALSGVVVWSTVQAHRHALLVAGNAVLVPVLILSALTLVAIGLNHAAKLGEFTNKTVEVPNRYAHSIREFQDSLEVDRESLRRLRAVAQAPLRERRGLYREDVAEFVAQYQRESRKYRRAHNGVQSLVMIGSTAMTTIAALDTKTWNWQNISVVCLGFSVTLASAFSGYYKYRERSYFLRQTADAIEEEIQALDLGIGEYLEFGPGQEDQAMARFVARVEALRNEQRRREQQLDQPADQTSLADSPSA